ncbi:unnamed protein product [Ostreobium quekettii]|uniref:Uncharacterized protein n=1 Tax=Ostreobium quekettii TaxID=121088 RepID=A0A8S1J7L8_9CHLO|nr:unnamed protein product [Ostreobium quekettii]
MGCYPGTASFQGTWVNGAPRWGSASSTAVAAPSQSSLAFHYRICLYPLVILRVTEAANKELRCRRWRHRAGASDRLGPNRELLCTVGQIAKGKFISYLPSIFRFIQLTA